MRRDAKWMPGGLLLWLGALALAVPAQAAGIEDFQLTRAVPADAALVVHGREHAGKAFLNEQMARVWKVVERQHFEKDIRTLMKGLFQQSGGDLQEFEQHWQQFNDLLLGVEWSSLFEHECAFAMKMSFPAPEMIVLGLSSPEKAEANFGGLESILKTLVGFAPEGTLVLTTQGEGDSVVHTLGFADAPFPLGEVMLAREEQVLMLGFGQTMPEQALALLRGEPGQTLAATERFKAALKRLPPPRDEFFYMDFTRFMGQVRTFADALISMADPTGEAVATQPVAVIPKKIIDAFDLFDYIASSSATEGLKTTEHIAVLLREDAQSKPLYGVFYGNGTLQDPLKFIPQKAQNCMVWSGFNLKALYDGILAFIRDQVPGGEDLLVQWEETKLTLPVNIENDILSWVGGEIRYFALPAKSAYQPGPWAVMVSVTDEAKAREILGRVFEAIEPLLVEKNGMLRNAQIEGVEGFKVVVHPMLAMMGALGQPTIGVHSGQLFLGSGEKVIASALATAAGESPNFGSNERFVKEGLPVEGNLMVLSFTDKTKMGEELGQFLTMVPMIGMFVPDLAQNPAGRALMSAAGKLGKVVRELNFYQSSCMVNTFDGRVDYTKVVTNYREPPKPAATEPAQEAAPAEEPEEPASGEE